MTLRDTEGRLKESEQGTEKATERLEEPLERYKKNVVVAFVSYGVQAYS